MNLEQLTILLRSAVVDKEMAALNAMRDITCFGEWRCDWNEFIAQAESEIQQIKRDILTLST